MRAERLSVVEGKPAWQEGKAAAAIWRREKKLMREGKELAVGERGVGDLRLSFVLHA